MDGVYVFWAWWFWLGSWFIVEKIINICDYTELQHWIALYVGIKSRDYFQVQDMNHTLGWILDVIITIQERLVVPDLQRKNLEQTVCGPFEHVDSAKPRKKIPWLEALKYKSVCNSFTQRVLGHQPSPGNVPPLQWLAGMTGLAESSGEPGVGWGSSSTSPWKDPLHLCTSL